MTLHVCASAGKETSPQHWIWYFKSHVAFLFSSCVRGSPHTWTCIGVSAHVCVMWASGSHFKNAAVQFGRPVHVCACAPGAIRTFSGVCFLCVAEQIAFHQGHNDNCLHVDAPLDAGVWPRLVLRHFGPDDTRRSIHTGLCVCILVSVHVNVPVELRELCIQSTAFKFKAPPLIRCLCVLSHWYISSQQHGAEQTSLTSAQHPQQQQQQQRQRSDSYYTWLQRAMSRSTPLLQRW